MTSPGSQTAGPGETDVLHYIISFFLILFRAITSFVTGAFFESHLQTQCGLCWSPESCSRLPQEYTHTHRVTHTHSHIHTHTHTHSHAFTHSHTHTHIHTCSHTHTPHRGVGTARLTAHTGRPGGHGPQPAGHLLLRRLLVCLGLAAHWAEDTCSQLRCKGGWESKCLFSKLLNGEVDPASSH